MLGEFGEEAYRITRLAQVLYGEPGQIGPGLIGRTAGLLMRHRPLLLKTRRDHPADFAPERRPSSSPWRSRRPGSSLLIRIAPINGIKSAVVGRNGEAAMRGSTGLLNSDIHTIVFEILRSWSIKKKQSYKSHLRSNVVEFQTGSRDHSINTY